MAKGPLFHAEYTLAEKLTHRLFYVKQNRTSKVKAKLHTHHEDGETLKRRHVVDNLIR